MLLTCLPDADQAAAVFRSGTLDGNDTGQDPGCIMKYLLRYTQRYARITTDREWN
jgi:hypothetical protein